MKKSKLRPINFAFTGLRITPKMDFFGITSAVGTLDGWLVQNTKGETIKMPICVMDWLLQE